MLIRRLNIEDFRVISNAAIEPGDGLNLFCGDNAMGKTSALEAIGVLSSLRSFRSARLAELVRYSRQGFRVSAILDEEGRETPVGIERSNGEVTLRAEGRRLSRVSELALRLPVQIIHPDSHLLISGGPKQRRRFLDWGVFHVEHNYLAQWRRYEKSLRQRNAAIRLNQSWSTAGAWDSVISDAASTIQTYRQQYIDELNAVLPEFTGAISETGKVDIEYQPGWDVGLELIQVLENTRDRDRRRGFTCSGPHRAELIFRVDGHPADRHISRGQQKMLVFSLLLAQVVLFQQKTGRRCVLLLDDLAAELDENHRDRLLGILQEMSVQTFVTAVKKESIRLEKWNGSKLFHVEHGKIREVI